MNAFIVVLFLLTIIIKCFHFENITENELLGDKKISEYVDLILEHYKKDDPVGIPGAPIPDPLPIPNLSHSLSIGRVDLKNQSLYGLSNFRITNVKVDIAKMKVEASLTIETLIDRGNYTLSTWLSKANGPFTVKLSDVFVKSTATLEVERSGRLEAQAINMDITFKTIEMDFKNLGFFASMFQGIMNSLGSFIFESIKPLILSEVNNNIRNDVNKQVRKVPQTFPNSISPFDQLISELRHKIRDKKFDPYKVNDYNNSVGIFDVTLKNTWLMGLSSVHRVGDIQFEIANKTIHALFQVGTQRLEGVSNWDISLIAGMMSRAGNVQFTVEYIVVEAKISQNMDTRNPPQLDNIELELGNIQVRFNGAGTVDYVIEFAINLFPNLLRYQIMDAMENPIKHRIQEILNRINVEKLIKDSAKKVDNDPNALLEILQ